MRPIHVVLSIFILQLTGSVYNTAYADDGARLYTTREEKREAGIKHEIFPWLVASGLAEFQWQWQRFALDNKDRYDYIDDTAASIQANFFISPVDWIKSEIITEYDTNTDELIVDEAELAFEYGPWELAFGKLYLPFGQYISHFANGPITEFGETRANSVSLAYNYLDDVDISFAVYRSNAHEIGSSNRIDWSAGIEAWPSDDVSVGISYLSDLADSEQGLLRAHHNRYMNKVPAISGYLLWVAKEYEFVLEFLGALESFDELKSDRDQPMAVNLEFTHYMTSRMDWTIRIEGSQEIEDMPELQLGIAVNYRIINNVFLTVEGLHGFFSDSLAKDGSDNDYKSVTTFGALLSVGF